MVRQGPAKPRSPVRIWVPPFFSLTLYIVATPIGNLKDISHRALEVLQSVDVICCEDTRVSKKLLHHYSIQKPLMSVHKFSEAKKVDSIVEMLEEGKDVALISDAGSPCIQDPGWRLVDAVYKQELEVSAVPGPCAVINALTLVGWAVDRFEFRGYLPKKASQKTKALQEAIEYPGITIFYVSSHEILNVMNGLEQFDTNVPCAVIKEMTKVFENVVRGDIKTVASGVRNLPAKGEYVLLLGEGSKISDDESIAKELEELINSGESFSSAVSIIAKKHSMSKNKLYNQYK